MKRQLGSVTAHKQPSVAVESKVKHITKPLAQAAQFVRDSQEEILKTPVAKLEKNALVAVFCVLKRAAAAIDRRLGPIRKRIDEEFAKMKPVNAGEGGHALWAGPFRVLFNNVNVDKLETDGQKLFELLARKHIPKSTVMFVPEPPPPFVQEEKVLDLVRTGKITQKEYDSVRVPMQPKMEVRVDVPDSLDDVIKNRLLGGLMG